MRLQSINDDRTLKAYDDAVSKTKGLFLRRKGGMILRVLESHPEYLGLRRQFVAAISDCESTAPKPAWDVTSTWKGGAKGDKPSSFFLRGDPSLPANITELALFRRLHRDI
jgi:hypothetical protein